MGRRRRAASSLLVLALVALPAAGGASPAAPVLAGTPRAEELTDMGMPLTALKAYLDLPARARPAGRVPPLIEALAAAGYPGKALALYAEERGRLPEPERSRAAYAAGAVRLAEGDRKAALAAYREVSAGSPLAGAAALAAARILAAASDPAAAVPPPTDGGGPYEAVTRGEIAMALGRPEAARRAWEEVRGAGRPEIAAWLRAVSGVGTAPGDVEILRRAAENAAERPVRAAAFEGLAAALSADGADEEALAAASRGLAEGDAWSEDVRRQPAWDNTRSGARTAWEAMLALIPLDADGARFSSDGRRFLSLAATHETARAAENGLRAAARRIRSDRATVDALRGEASRSERRAAEIRARLERLSASLERTRGRLEAAAEAFSTDAYGRRAAPRLAGLFDAAEASLANLAARQEAIAKRIESAGAGTRPDGPPPADRIMIYFSGARLDRTRETLHSLEGRIAFLRAGAWNAWKNAYAKAANDLLDASEKALPAARRTAARAEAVAGGSRRAGEDLDRLSMAFSRYAARLARTASVLERRRGELRETAHRAFRSARAELSDALGRPARRLHHMAGRAAAARRSRGTRADGNGAPLSPEDRRRLLREAIRHFEASLSPGSPGPADDEALYALGELRFEETEAGYVAAGGPEHGRKADFSVPAGFFRRVIDEFPASPYAESAHYGLALCRQEEGDGDGAADALSGLVRKFPRTRYADEAALRLGEHAFDRLAFADAEGWYRRIPPGASADLRATALFKLGWTLFLLERPSEAVETFHSALMASREARRTGGIPAESLRMLARALVESGRHGEAERILASRGGTEDGPALLRHVQDILDAQNRYAEAVRIADRMGTSYPLASERLESEIAAANALRKAGSEDDGMARRGRLFAAVGPGSPWQSAKERTLDEIARANAAAEEGLRASATYFHAKTREGPGAARAAVLAQYDAYLALFPSSPRVEEISFRRAWLLFEDGRRKESRSAFEAVARRARGDRAEESWYMAVQSAKDVSSPGDAASQEEVVRLCREYADAAPSSDRLRLVLMDRARARFNLKRYAEAAGDAEAAAGRGGTGEEIRAALRLAGEGRFEAGDFAAAEQRFRALRESSPDPGERRNAEKWVGFSLFRRAETLPREEALKAAQTFLQASTEFPGLDIAPVARFRAGSAFAEGNRPDEAIAAFLAVETMDNAATLSADATRRLAPLFEARGRPIDAARRYEKFPDLPGASPGDAFRMRLRAADLYSQGTQDAESRRVLRTLAARDDTPPAVRVRLLFRVAESLRAEGSADASDAAYAETVAVHRALGGADPETAGKALFLRAESRFRAFRAISIGPPLEKTFKEKQASLEACTLLYVEAAGTGDAETAAGSLHRMGEALEEFRSAILASPPPSRLSAAEREEYLFLLEERAAPIEEKAVEAYRKGVRQAAAAGVDSSWARQSLSRLKALRPAKYGKKGEFALPVLTVPEFHGLIERNPQ